MHTGSFDLGDGQVQLALFFTVAFFCMAFGGLLLAMAAFAMVVVPGFGVRRLAEVAGPGQAAQAYCGNSHGQEGKLA
ncbi:hypothetical protein D3C79_1036600 [compost metagenome]